MGVLLTAGMDLLQFILAAVFLFSGAVKLDDLQGFGAITASYRIVPTQLAELVRKGAVIVPVTELLAGGLLLINELGRVSLLYMAASLVGYTVIETYELVTGGRKFNCGCYGTAFSVELTWRQVAKNLLLLGLVFILLS